MKWMTISIFMLMLQTDFRPPFPIVRVFPVPTSVLCAKERHERARNMNRSLLEREGKLLRRKAWFTLHSHPSPRPALETPRTTR